jgi:hypothetical protein
MQRVQHLRKVNATKKSDVGSMMQHQGLGRVDAW